MVRRLVASAELCDLAWLSHATASATATATATASASATATKNT
ncbi:hypothetical protein [Paenibacillus odorifer]|nr:hypothetical protein [Paenibacillus odorifer]